MPQEALALTVERIKGFRSAERATASALAVAEDVLNKQRELAEVQGFLDPIFETVNRRLYILEGLGILSLVQELADIYGGEKVWRPNLLRRINPEEKQPGRIPNLERPKQGVDERHDPGASIKISVNFSKLAVSPEPIDLNMDVLKGDYDGSLSGSNVDKWINFETRRSLYKKAGRSPKKLGLCLEVSKNIVDVRELDGIDLTGFKYPIDNLFLYEATRQLRLVVFENIPRRITITPGGRSKEGQFNLKSGLRPEAFIQGVRNYLENVVAEGGDISAMPHTANLPFVSPLGFHGV